MAVFLPNGGDRDYHLKSEHRPDQDDDKFFLVINEFLVHDTHVRL